MFPFNPTLRALLAIGLLSFAACDRSLEAKKARHLARGDKYFSQKQYNEAILEYRNVLRFEESNDQAIQRLGVAYYQVGNLMQSLPFLLKTKEIEPNNRDARIKLGKVFLAGRKLKEARDEAQFILKKDPKNFEAILLLAGSARTPKEVDAAIKRLEGVRRDFGDRARFHMALAALYMRKKEMVTAERYFKQAVAKDPKSIESHHALANFYLAKRDLPQAEEEFKTGATLGANQPGTGMALANFYLITGKTREAKKSLVELIDKHDGYLPAWRRLARIQIGEKKFAEAIKTVRVILKKNRRDLEGRFLRGRIRLAQGKAPEAIPDFQAVLKQEPGLSEVRYQLALANLRLGNVQQAKQELRRTLDSTPRYARASLTLAELNLGSGAPEAAIDLLEPVVTRQPRNIRALKLLGMAHLAKRDAAKATKAFRKAVNIAPKEPHAIYMLGVGLSATGQLEQAGKKFEEALALKADYLEPLAGLAQLAYARKKPEAALARVERQLRVVPASGPFHHLLGKIQLTRGESKTAEQSFLRAIKLEPKLLASYMALGALYGREKRYDEALAKAEQARKIYPKNLGAHMLVGVIQQQKGAVEQAKKTYERALELNPRFGPAANNLAYLYAEHGGDKEKALALAQTAKEVLPNDPSVSDTLGWVLYKRGLYDGALNHLTRSASRLSKNPEVQYHLGMTYYKLGNKKAAKQTLAQALKLGTRFAGANKAKETLVKLR